MGQSYPGAQAIVFDLGGTYLRCGVWRSAAGVSSLRRVKIATVWQGQPSSVVWDGIRSQLEDYHQSVTPAVAAEAPIVVSFPGPIEDRRKILSAPTFLGDDTAIPDLVGQLREDTGRAVYILNDISAAAWYLSSKTRADRFMVVTISSGIGSKIFDRKHPAGVIESPAWAGEIGHMTAEDSPDAARCDCGGRGHLAAIASGRGIERAARRCALDEPDAFARSMCVGRYGATAITLSNEEHLVPAALAGDEWCLALIHQATRPLARVLLAVILAAGLERVIVIGGFALSLGSVYLQILRGELTAVCRYSVINDEIDSLVELGTGCEEACLMGAGSFAERLLRVRQ